MTEIDCSICGRGFSAAITVAEVQSGSIKPRSCRRCIARPSKAKLPEAPRSKWLTHLRKINPKAPAQKTDDILRARAAQIAPESKAIVIELAQRGCLADEIEVAAELSGRDVRAALFEAGIQVLGPEVQNKGEANEKS